jgi:hypothetical protein
MTGCADFGAGWKRKPKVRLPAHAGIAIFGISRARRPGLKKRSAGQARGHAEDGVGAAPLRLLGEKFACHRSTIVKVRLSEIKRFFDGAEMAAALEAKYQGSNLSVEVEAFEEVALEPESFDLIVAATSFHWVPPETGPSKWVLVASKPPGNEAESGVPPPEAEARSMPVVLYQKMPPAATLEMIEAVMEEMDVHAVPPNGLIVHTVVNIGGRLTVIDVWESQEDWDKFAEMRLGPAFATVAGRMGVDLSQAGEPETEVLEVLSIVHGE